MNKIFKPIMLLMAFAMATFSFSNQSYANCTITDITLASSSCTGTGQITATFTVTYATSGPGTYDVNITTAGASGTATGTESGTVSVTVNNIGDDDGTLSVSATMAATINGASCSSSFGPTDISGAASNCTAPAACADCNTAGTLTITNQGDGSAGMEICVDNDGSYQGVDVISNGTVTDGRTVVFTASNSITLQAGFSANTAAGGTFTATNGTLSCTSPLTDENGEETHSLTYNPVAGVKVTPNPLSSSATISYSLENEGQVMIQVFNLKGEAVATLMNGTQVSGQHTVNFEASNLPNGFYYLSVQTSNERITEQMVIMR